jgi:phage terminase large subunit
MASHDIILLPHQMKALNSSSRETLLLGGLGVGKSFTGALWIIKNAIAHPKSKMLIAANTYSQLMTASVAALTQLLDQFGIPYNAVLSGSQKRIEINKTVVHLYSLENFNQLRGIEVNFAWVDELAFSRDEALKVLLGRMRWQVRGTELPIQLLYTTTPSGFNFLYDKFGSLQRKTGPNLATKQKCLISAKTQDNTFLPDGYYSSLLEEYGGEDSPLARQELFGEFTNIQGGGIYWGFDRDKNTRMCEIDPRYPLYLGIDFNVDNLNGVAMQFIRGKFYVIEHILLDGHNSNTYDLAEYIVANYANKYRVKIIPDSTGSSRKTSAIAGQSDHKILRDAGLEVLNTKNPLIRNRQNNVNMKFKKQQLVIDPKLDTLIKEVETLNSRDKEGLVSHAAVTIGYVLWYLDPLKRVKDQRGSYERQL